MILTHKISRAKRKIVALLTIWLLLIQMAVPPLIMAEEFGTPVPSAEPSPSPDTTLAGSETVMETGNAEAESITVTETNVTAADSTIETAVVTVDEPSADEDVVLFPSAPESEPDVQPTATVSGEINLTIDNQATASSHTTAQADTGNNAQTNSNPGQDTGMATGDATAQANGMVVADTTLVNSSIQVGIVTVMAEWQGDIILDPLEVNGEQASIFGPGLTKLAIDNSGQVTTGAVAIATTGDNSQTASGQATITTGEATALSINNTIVGATLVDAEVLQIFAENLWLWNGLIYNLEYPGSTTNPSSLLGQTGTAIVCSGECAPVNATITNNTEVTNLVTAVANTGGNTQVSSGSAITATGDARAAATATTIVNTTLINSKMSLLYLLLFKPWNGNLIFAYPDLVTVVTAPASVREGEDIPFTISVQNTGLAKARGVNYHYAITNDSHDVGQGGEAWGDVAAGASYTETVRFPTAGRGGHKVRLVAEAKGTNTELSSSNNAATAVVEVLVQDGPAEANQADTQTEQEEGEPTEVPQLNLTSVNNAGEFVYAGDGVAYDMVIENEGPIAALNVVLVHEFYAFDGKRLAQMAAPVGDIELSRRKTIHFVMSTSPALKTGNYYTRAYALGESDQGTLAKSNSVDNAVPIRGREGSLLVTRVEAEENGETGSREQGQVLGAVTQAPVCSDCQSEPWYIALVAGTAVYYAHGLRRRQFESLAKLGVSLPLAAYGGLLYTAGDCRQGLILVSADFWCQYFLAVSLGGYVILAGLVYAAKRLAKKFSLNQLWAWR